MVFFLGDYIYENGIDATGGVRNVPLRAVREETVTLERYASSTPCTRLTGSAKRSRLVPLVVTWDDHEVDNDYTGAISQDNDPVEAFCADAQPPIRLSTASAPAPVLPPQGPNMLLYRRLTFGLAEFSVLDTRQYRMTNLVATADPSLRCGAGPSKTMTGAEQERWLLDGLTVPSHAGTRCSRY